MNSLDDFTNNEKLVTPSNNAWLTTWTKEASDRIEAYERGEIEAEDFDIVMDRLRKQIE